MELHVSCVFIVALGSVFFGLLLRSHRLELKLRMSFLCSSYSFVLFNVLFFLWWIVSSLLFPLVSYLFPILTVILLILVLLGIFFRNSVYFVVLLRFSRLFRSHIRLFFYFVFLVCLCIVILYFTLFSFVRFFCFVIFLLCFSSVHYFFSRLFTYSIRLFSFVWYLH